ncbi:MAG: arylsulfatase [Propionicimonas sp.]
MSNPAEAPAGAPQRWPSPPNPVAGGLSPETSTLWRAQAEPDSADENHGFAPEPDIVLFVADDLGWGDLGCNGGRGIPTPNLDRLAARGLRYSDCHAVSSVCSPSRYGILTGRYPWRSPLQSGVLGGTDPSILAPGLPTIASRLADAGYHTGAFGKWHLGLNWVRQDGSTVTADHDGPFAPDLQADGRDVDYTQPFSGGPLDHGFDRFFGIAGSLDMPPYCFLEGRRVRDLPVAEKEPLITSQRPGLQSLGWQDDQVDLRVTEEVTAWIRERPSDRPFFAYVASAAPHRPCVPPAFVRGASAAGDRGDSVVLVDWMVGEILDALEASGRADRTIVAFTSDNGAPLIFPEDGDVTEYPPNGPWRGQKADAFEGGHRVPLIIAGPGVAAGATVADEVSLLDLLPTLTGASGADLDGHPLDLTHSTESPQGRVSAVTAFDGRLVLRRGTRKAILGSGSGGFSEPTGRPAGVDDRNGQLYDLASDPAEQHNLWRENHQEAAGLWTAFVRESGYGTQVGAIHPVDQP